MCVCSTKHFSCLLFFLLESTPTRTRYQSKKQGFSFKFYRSFSARECTFVCLSVCAINWKPNNHDTVHVYRKRVTTRRLRGCVCAPIVLSRRTAVTTVRTATTRFFLSFLRYFTEWRQSERCIERSICERITFNNDGDDTTFIVFSYFLFILKIVCFFFTLIVCALMLFCFLFSSRKRLSCCAPFHIL